MRFNECLLRDIRLMLEKALVDIRYWFYKVTIDCYYQLDSNLVTIMFKIYPTVNSNALQYSTLIDATTTINFDGCNIRACINNTISYIVYQLQNNLIIRN